MELERSKRRIADLVAMFETPEVRARLKAAHAAQLDLTAYESATDGMPAAAARIRACRRIPIISSEAAIFDSSGVSPFSSEHSVARFLA